MSKDTQTSNGNQVFSCKFLFFSPLASFCNQILRIMSIRPVYSFLKMGKDTQTSNGNQVLSYKFLFFFHPDVILQKKKKKYFYFLIQEGEPLMGNFICTS